MLTYKIKKTLPVEIDELWTKVRLLGFLVAMHAAGKMARAVLLPLLLCGVARDLYLTLFLQKISEGEQ